MLNMERKTRLDSSKVINKAVDFFGPDGLGLDVVDTGDCCARFEGGGGFVFLRTQDLEGKRKTSVLMEGREWEVKIKEFMGRL